jgi:hypothetical protein
MEEFNFYLTLYGGTNPSLKPRIPKIHPNKTAYLIIQTLNQIISDSLTEEDPIEKTHLYTYCAAMTTISLLHIKIKSNQVFKKSPPPPWKVRLENKINRLRSDLSKILE